MNNLQFCHLERPGRAPDQRAAIESLWGRRTLEDEAISIRAIEPPTLSDERKHELVEKLKKYFAEVDSHRQSGSSEEEEIIEEAMKSVRPGYTSVKIVLDTSVMDRRTLLCSCIDPWVVWNLTTPSN